MLCCRLSNTSWKQLIQKCLLKIFEERCSRANEIRKQLYEHGPMIYRVFKIIQGAYEIKTYAFTKLITSCEMLDKNKGPILR